MSTTAANAAPGRAARPGGGVGAGFGGDGINWRAMWAIYKNEMKRTKKTLLQSVASPVISTVLYFIVFGGAIGSRIQSVADVDYGLFIVPGLVMLSLLTQSVSNASLRDLLSEVHRHDLRGHERTDQLRRDRGRLRGRGGDEVADHRHDHPADRDASSSTCASSTRSSWWRSWC